jgi:hypothetical protein
MRFPNIPYLLTWKGGTCALAKPEALAKEETYLLNNS